MRVRLTVSLPARCHFFFSSHATPLFSGLDGMVQNGAVSGGAAVGQAFQPDSLLVRLESLTYGAKCYPGLNHAVLTPLPAAQVLVPSGCCDGLLYQPNKSGGEQLRRAFCCVEWSMTLALPDIPESERT
ncbi:MAG TPA: hypothetical protein VKA46_29710, partial [Gemmataceae bacterium]|nr:hypothetical protein [Gemmataceae bacterium]